MVRGGVARCEGLGSAERLAGLDDGTLRLAFVHHTFINFILVLIFVAAGF